MRRVLASIVAVSAAFALFVSFSMMGRPELVIAEFGCVSFILGVRALVDVMRDALPEHPSAVVVTALVAGALLAMGLANPEVWPLFVLGFPSCSWVVLEAWLHAREGLARRTRSHRKVSSKTQELATAQAGTQPTIATPLR